LGKFRPKSKEIRPKFWGPNLTARIRPFRARKIITVYPRLQKKYFKILELLIFPDFEKKSKKLQGF
jgi:hypothetical protein